MSYAIKIDKSQDTLEQEAIKEMAEEVTGAPSGRELLIYGICCAVQGSILAMYLAGVIFVPLAISRGMFANLW